MRASRPVLVLLILLSQSVRAESENFVTGSPEEDVLSGTPGVDHFFGGEGADTFIVDHLSVVPDQVIDFDYLEGDRIELTFPEASSPKFGSESLSINSRGVVTWDLLDGQEVPIVGINARKLDLTLDKRKGKVFLKFEMPVQTKIL